MNDLIKDFHVNRPLKNESKSVNDVKTCVVQQIIMCINSHLNRMDNNVNTKICVESNKRKCETSNIYKVICGKP